MAATLEQTCVLCVVCCVFGKHRNIIMREFRIRTCSQGVAPGPAPVLSNLIRVSQSHRRRGRGSMMGAGVIRVGLSWSRTPRTPRAGSARIPNPAPAVDRGPNSRYSYSPTSSLPTADSTALPSGDVRSHVRNSRRATATVSPSPRCPLIPLHFKRAVKPSFPRRACPREVGGGNPLPGRTYTGGITVTWY